MAQSSRAGWPRPAGRGIPRQNPVFGPDFDTMKIRNRPAVQAGRFFFQSFLIFIVVRTNFRQIRNAEEKNRPNRMGRFFTSKQKKSRRKRPGFLNFFHDMKNPGGHGFFNGGFRPLRWATWGAAPRPRSLREGWRSFHLLGAVQFPKAGEAFVCSVRCSFTS
ncbi:hypothetical protein JQM60_01540 [Butyricicoccus pullicaecorum]|nr:hypothetical protein [Butyricicoccus pullicaecorum]